MPVENGEYNRLTANEIRDALESELRSEFGQDIDLTQSSVFSTLAEALAATIADNQERSLQEVYQSAFLDTATGVDLDRVVSIIGIRRRDAVHATGVQQFSASGPVGSNRIIQNGTTIQTQSDDPVEFETTESASIQLFDSFEDGDVSEYSGDTNSASVVSDPDAPDGSEILSLDATAGAHIYRDDKTITRGSTNHALVKPDVSDVQALTFMVDPGNPDDRYQVVLDADNLELRLERVEGGTVTNVIDSDTVSLSTNEWHEIEFRPNITGNISARLYDQNDDELTSIGGSDDTFVSGAIGFLSVNANSSKEFDFYTQSQVSTNIRALNGGIRGNVGANTIVVMPSPPTGIQSTTNLYQTGDADLTDINDAPLIAGRNRETDDELRERAEEAVTEGGDATHDAIVSALVNDVAGVRSVSLFENKTDSDNTGSGGLPPYSFEAVVFGGAESDIAKAIFDKKAVTSRDYGGAHGQAVSATAEADSNGQQFTIDFSRPIDVNIDATLDIVVDDTYIGNDPLRDRIVQYIGGTTSNDNDVIGLGVDENVIIDQIQDIVVGDNTGVVAMDESVNGDPIETVPTSTTVNGIESIAIANTEVAQTDATDSSITINKRQL